MQEKHSDPPLSFWKQEINFHVKGTLPVPVG